MPRVHGMYCVPASSEQRVAVMKGGCCDGGWRMADGSAPVVSCLASDGREGRRPALTVSEEEGISIQV